MENCALRIKYPERLVNKDFFVKQTNKIDATSEDSIKDNDNRRNKGGKQCNNKMYT